MGQSYSVTVDIDIMDTMTIPHLHAQPTCKYCMPQVAKSTGERKVEENAMTHERRKAVVRHGRILSRETKPTLDACRPLPATMTSPPNNARFPPGCSLSLFPSPITHSPVPPPVPFSTCSTNTAPHSSAIQPQTSSSSKRRPGAPPSLVSSDPTFARTTPYRRNRDLTMRFHRAS